MLFPRYTEPFFLAGLFLVQLVFVALYLGQEQTAHFWDYAMYANLAAYWFGLGGPEAWIGPFFSSLSQNYNLFFALPSLVSFSLFGSSRFVFILSNTIFFLFLNQVALGLIAHRLFKIPKMTGVLWAMLATLFIPLFWIPLLQGYPDHAAAACLCFAFFFALKRAQNWRAPLFMGLALALAIIFRRHFAYPALTLVAACGICDLWNLKKESFAFDKIKTFFWRFLSIGGTALAVLVLVEPLYVKEMLTTNFVTLYASYKQTPIDFFLFLFSRVGLVLFISVAWGYFFLWRKAPQKRLDLVMLFLFAFLWLVLWSTGPVQLAAHYLLGVLPLFCFVGLWGLFSSPLSRNVKFLLIFLLGAHTLFVFWPRDNFPFPSDPPHIGFFATPRPPWVRHDHDQLKALARYLKENSTPQDKILIAGSSFSFNQDLIRAVYTDWLKDSQMPYRFIPAPEIDGAQEPPLDAFASANIYVVPDKPHYHLPATGQKVVTALWSTFPPQGRASDLFEKDAVSFSLEHGIRLSIWRRKPWTGETLHKKLKEIRAISNIPRKWLVARGALHTRPKKNKNGLSAFVGTLSKQTPVVSFFYDEPLSFGAYRLSLELAHEKTCQNLSLFVHVEDSKGLVLFEKKGTLPQNPSLYYQPFLVPNEKNRRAFLTLSLSGLRNEACLFYLSNLVVKKALSRIYSK